MRFTEYNPQSQPKIVWPAAFPVVRSYLDQLVRNNGLAAERTTAIASALDAAEKQTGAARGASLTTLAKAGGQGRERREGSGAREVDVGGDQAAGGGVEVAVAARRRGAATRNQASPHRGVVRARCFRTGRRRNRPRDGFVHGA